MRSFLKFPEISGFPAICYSPIFPDIFFYNKRVHNKGAIEKVLISRH